MEQRKQMKDAIIKEIRKTDEKSDKAGANAGDASGKKKRNRINKERVDINTVGNNGMSQGGRNDRQNKSGNAGQQNGGGKHNKDRFKKPAPKAEVSDEDVAKQVKETLARLTNKGKIKLPSIVRRNARLFRTVSKSWNWKNRKKAKS